MTDRLKERLANHTVRIQDMNASWDEPCSLSREALDRITQLEAEVERLARHWQVLSDILEDTHIENDEPARVKWEDEWHYGPAAEAMNAMMRSLKKLCRAALHQGDRKP